MAGGTLVTLCRGTVCVPFRLDSVKHRKTKDGTFIDASALGDALNFSIGMKNGAVRIIPGAGPAEGRLTVPAYHDKWGARRGFRRGQTLPDIPLYDLKGSEVRFSSFLGKKYIIYVWASW